MNENDKDKMELKIIIVGIIISSLFAVFLYFTEYIKIPFYIPYAILCIVGGSYYLIDAIKTMIRIKKE